MVIRAAGIMFVDVHRSDEKMQHGKMRRLSRREASLRLEGPDSYLLRRREGDRCSIRPAGDTSAAAISVPASSADCEGGRRCEAVEALSDCRVCGILGCRGSLGRGTACLSSSCRTCQPVQVGGLTFGRALELVLVQLASDLSSPSARRLAARLGGSAWIKPSCVRLPSPTTSYAHNRTPAHFPHPPSSGSRSSSLARPVQQSSRPGELVARPPAL